MESEEKNIWTIQQVHTIINLVRDRPFFYDKKHPEYKSKNRKETGWDEIAAIMETKTALECKRKWNTLRIQQRRIICKDKKRITRNVQWHFYELLQFLIPHMECVIGDDLQKTELSEYEDEQYDEEQLITFPNIDGEKNFITNSKTSNLINAETELSSNDEQNDRLRYLNQINTAMNTPVSAIPLIINNPMSITTHPNDNISITRNETDQIIQNNLLDVPTSSSSSASISLGQCYKCSLDHGRNSIELTRSNEHNTNAGINYFLLDIQQQMAKLNDLAQLELKIEIQKLLLDKLRCVDNLQNN